MTDKPTRRSLLHDLGEFLRCLFGGSSKLEPGDPHAYGAPVRRGPSGGSGAASVAEPEEENGLFPPRRS
jgi:hypothetical protein